MGCGVHLVWWTALRGGSAHRIKESQRDALREGGVWGRIRKEREIAQPRTPPSHLTEED